MDYYKGIRYVENIDDMSIPLLSHQEANSINDQLLAVKGNGLVNVIKDTAEEVLLDDELNPAGYYYAQTWRTDVGYQTTISPGDYFGKEPGFFPIPISSVVPTGANGSFTLDGVSGVSFTSCTGLYINNIFGPEFENYKIFIDVPTTSVAGVIAARYTDAGVADGSTNYMRAGYGASDATPTVFQNTAAGSAFSVFTDGTGRNFTAEIDLIKPYGGYYPLALIGGSYNDNSTRQTVYELASQYNSGTAPSFDGIYLYASSPATIEMTGTVRVYGYN